MRVFQTSGQISHCDGAGEQFPLEFEP